jgi:maleate isomerase
MPSLPGIQLVEDRLSKPVSSAAIATVYRILKTLDLKAEVRGGRF